MAADTAVGAEALTEAEVEASMEVDRMAATAHSAADTTAAGPMADTTGVAPLATVARSAGPAEILEQDAVLALDTRGRPSVALELATCLRGSIRLKEAAMLAAAWLGEPAAV